MLLAGTAADVHARISCQGLDVFEVYCSLRQSQLIDAGHIAAW